MSYVIEYLLYFTTTLVHYSCMQLTFSFAGVIDIIIRVGI